ncbi:MAG: THUMP domain-containing protein [Natrialbaceae archaeon]|nr:THUMP domain-containing protein [Natrialbaceae archaeon]
MHPPGADTVLVRHGEINTKSRSVKGAMEGRLVRNIEAMLADRDIPGTVEREWNRPLVHTAPDAVAAATNAAADAFGVVSVSASSTVAPDLEAICDGLASVADAVYDGGSFAVDARRAHKDHPFTSETLEREGGSAIWAAVEDRFEPSVDLEDPDLCVGVEVRKDTAYIYLERVVGPGGLPLGTQDPLVALVSGGIDSPVAAYETMRRGCPIRPIYIDLGAFGGRDHEARAFETVRTLSAFAPTEDMGIWHVPAGEAIARLAETMDRGRMLSLRRLFFRIGERIAERENAVGIVTGEAIGQKSSQTARNLSITSRVTELPIHRPLLTWDKTDIVERAREIETYRDSTIDAGCNRIAPSHPETRGTYRRLLEDEPDELLEWADAAAADAEKVEP